MAWLLPLAGHVRGHGRRASGCARAVRARGSAGARGGPRDHRRTRGCALHAPATGVGADRGVRDQVAGGRRHSHALSTDRSRSCSCGAWSRRPRTLPTHRRWAPRSAWRSSPALVIPRPLRSTVTIHRAVTPRTSRSATWRTRAHAGRSEGSRSPSLTMSRPSERAACEHALRAVNPLVLAEGQSALALDDEIADLATLSVERWVGPATDWATVTPVVLDRFPRRGRSPRDELLASIANAGLPEPAEVQLLAGPPLAGAPPGGALRGEVPPGMRVHSRLRFEQPIRGPVLVGRGRFRGVGLFLPERWR